MLLLVSWFVGPESGARPAPPSIEAGAPAAFAAALSRPGNTLCPANGRSPPVFDKKTCRRNAGRFCRSKPGAAAHRAISSGPTRF
jgi:hypothetical protein